MRTLQPLLAAVGWVDKPGISAAHAGLPLKLQPSLHRLLKAVQSPSGATNPINTTIALATHCQADLNLADCATSVRNWPRRISRGWGMLPSCSTPATLSADGHAMEKDLLQIRWNC